jgi:hypothetical protein
MDKKELRDYLGQNQHFNPGANPQQPNQRWWSNVKPFQVIINVLFK